MERNIKVALVQYEIGPEWAQNMDQVETLLSQARTQGAELAVLPELFAMPYDMDLVPQRAEPVPEGPTCRKLATWAKKFGLAIVGGSVPEAADGKIHNTATLWDPEGRFLGRHRKMHLFDVTLPGGVTVMESSVFTPGNSVTVLSVLGLRLGLAVCFDVRFPELFRLMALQGAEFVALPGAFNQVSGPAHWEMLLRNRAVENTFYVAGVSGLAGPGAPYAAWGHSMLVDPFAEKIVEMGRARGIGLGVLKPDRLQDIRRRLPVLKQRRTDLYRLESTEAQD